MSATKPVLVTSLRSWTLCNWPPSRGPLPKRLRQKPKIVPAKIKMEMLPEGTPPLVTRKDKTHEFCCDIHVETLASLSLYQANRVVTACDKNGCCGLLLGRKDDFLPRKKDCSGRPTSGKCKKPKIPPTVVVDLYYPLSKTARVTIPPFKQNGPSQSWGAITWSIAQVYKQIYKEWKKWNVWGLTTDC